MSKPRMSGADIELFERLKRDNKILKKQVAALRREIQRLDYDHIDDLVKSQEESGTTEEKIEYKSKNEREREQWVCFECNKGILKLVIINKPNEKIYFRKCDNCGKRTRTKKYTKDVKGIE